MTTGLRELVDRRCTGALRMVDVNTGLRVTEGLRVAADGVRLSPNRSGDFVVMGVRGLEAHRRAFESPPVTPAAESIAVEVTVEDPAGRYLPRLATVRFPRDPVIANAVAEDSLFQAVRVPLHVAPAGPVPIGAAVLRATVVSDPDDRPIGGALLRVQVGGNVLARGVSEWRGRLRGEAVVAVPGIPITTWGDGNGAPGEGEEEAPVMVHTVPATVEVIVDPAFGPDADDVPDPDAVEAVAEGLLRRSFDVELQSGRTLVRRLAIPLP